MIALIFPMAYTQVIRILFPAVMSLLFAYFCPYKYSFFLLYVIDRLADFMTFGFFNSSPNY